LGPAVSEKKNQNKIQFHSDLPTLFGEGMTSETNNFSLA
jgi:hypothetical protein